MHCNTEKGHLDPQAQLCARAERFGKCSDCSIQGNGDNSADEGRRRTWKANPGQDFEWEELFSKMGGEQSGRRMCSYCEREGNTV